MRSSGSGHGARPPWHVVRPRRPSLVPGVAMAGFRHRGVASERFRLIPHPTVTLIFDFGAAPPVIDDGSGNRRRGSLVAGLGLTGAVWGQGSDFACLQVRLAPTVAGAVLGVGLGELNRGVVTLPDLWGRRADRVNQRLAELGSWEKRFAFVDALLARRLAGRSGVDSEVAWAWQRMLASRGTARVEGLAAELGWSRKRLWSRFGDRFGLPPKRAASLVRFDHAAHLLAAGRSAARVAAVSGYADQSHLHREVAAFTGATPAAMAKEPFLAVDVIAWAGRLAHLPRRHG